MLDDFTPIIHTLDGRTIRVFIIGDVHIGAKECALSEFESFLRKVQADDDSYICIVGDMLDNGLKNSMTNVYEATLSPSEQVEKAVELLSPVKDKILGCVSGNHELRSRREADLCPLFTVFCILRKQNLYRQNMCFIRVILGKESTKDRYAILLMHGKSASKKQRFQYAIEGVDAICTGHLHQGLAEKPARIEFGKNNIVSVKPLVSVTATSWLNYGGYGAAGMYLPNATRNPQALELEYTNSNARSGNIRLIW